MRILLHFYKKPLLLTNIQVSKRNDSCLTIPGFYFWVTIDGHCQNL